MHSSKLEGLLDFYLVKKAPALPKWLKEFIVWIAPWLVLVMVVNSIGGIFIGLIFGSVEPRMMVTGYGQAYYLLIILSLVIAAMQIYALPRVFKRNKWGWRLVLYASLLNFVALLIALTNSSTQQFSLFVLLEAGIKTLIYFYLLFQIRKFYK
jgi:hypothetical protein